MKAISYQMLTFKLNGIVIHFAEYKNNIGFYAAQLAINEFLTTMTSFKNLKGAVQFPLDKLLPIHLNNRMVAFNEKKI